MMLDIVMLALVIVACLGAAAYAQACAGLIDVMPIEVGPPPEGPAP
jgi:hypothetical protein